MTHTGRKRLARAWHSVAAERARADHTRPGGRSGGGGGRGAGRRSVLPHRALRRETVSTVAVIPDAADFALMRRYASFGFADHAVYLRRVASHLRWLAGRGGDVSVALFDPVAYTAYCEEAGLDPDRASSRCRYTGEIAAAGATVRYDGRPMGLLLPLLLAERERDRSWERGTELLAGAGACSACGRPLAGCAFERAAKTLADILRRCAPGVHHLVCSLLPSDEPLTAALLVEIAADGEVRLDEPVALLLCTVLAAGLAGRDHGGLVLRSAPEDDSGSRLEVVRGWSVRDGGLRPLTAAEVFAAYCTDAQTGEPLPPEPGVDYRAGTDLPRYRCGAG